MSQVKITKRAVDALKAKSKDVFLWDSKLSGYGVRCRPSGAKYYFVKMRSGGRQRWLTIGQHGAPWTAETARKEALRLMGKREEGIDPGAVRDELKAIPTMENLATRFVQEHVVAKKKESTAKEYRRQLDGIIMPILGKIRVSDISRADISRLHHKLRKTPYQANRILALLSKFFTWAERLGEVKGGNPARGIERFKEEKRELFLGSIQLAQLGAAMRQMLREKTLRPQEAAAIRLLLFTGCRLGEILTLKWEYVDIANGILNLPDSKTGAKTVHLGAPAHAVLSELPRIKKNPFVIPSPRFKGQHLINLEKPWLAVRKKAGLPKTRLHDLRHAYGSMGAGAGFGLPVIGALLGHSQASTTQRYAHVAANPLKAAADAIGSRLLEALDKEPQEGKAS